MAKNSLKTRKSSITKKPGFRLGMIFSGAMTILALIFLFFYYSYKSMFANNDHFLLKRIIVRSGGWWEGKKDFVAGKLNLVPDKTHIFLLDLKKLRTTLEKEPTVEKVKVSRILPDTLKFSIIERVPKATLYNSKSPLLTDGVGMVMDRNSCIRVGSLPVITGFKCKKKKPEPGMQLYQLLPPLKLIDLFKKQLPSLNIYFINVKNPEYYQAWVYDRRTRRKYLFYISRKQIPERLAKLKNAMESIRMQRPSIKEIDLRYDGQIITRH